MKKSYRPNQLDFDSVSPDATVMQLRDDGATRDETIEKSDENAAAAEQVEEDEENAEVVDAARRDVTKL